jgi:4'-phosphopantetheinyl transferase
MTRWLARGEHEIPGTGGPAAPGWVTTVEAGRLAQLRFTKRRTEFLLRRWTAKHAVAAALGLDLEGAPDRDGRPGHDGGLARIAVLNHPSGAPYVLLDGAPIGVDVSVTDRAGWAACLVGAGLDAVGVDLELVEPRSDGFVSDFLTAPEQDYVRSRTDEDARAAAANLMWSAKESALKVLRTGLRADTRTVEVTLDGDVSAGAATAADSPAGGWQRLDVRHTVTGQTFPGWWRRDGSFVLTMTTTRPVPPPAMLPTSGDLATATPVHSWLVDPVVPPGVPSVVPPAG